MTTIAAKRDNGIVRIAWDSQATAGNTASYGANKVTKINGQFAIGVTGRVRYMNMIERARVEPVDSAEIISPGFDGYGYLIEEVVPSWMHAVKNSWHNTPHDDDDNVPGGKVLVVLAGGIYEVDWDFSVQDQGEFAAVGSGGHFALAAMHLGKSAKAAVEVARDLDLYTGGVVKEMKL